MIKISDICKMFGVEIKNKEKANRKKWKWRGHAHLEEPEFICKDYRTDQKYFYSEFGDWPEAYEEEQYTLRRHITNPNLILIDYESYVPGCTHDYCSVIVDIEEE